MKQTEIIIETQRVTVIQRHRPTIHAPNQQRPADLQVADTSGGNNRTSADGELGNGEIQVEEKDSCTDSRDR